MRGQLFCWACMARRGEARLLVGFLPSLRYENAQSGRSSERASERTVLVVVGRVLVRPDDWRSCRVRGCARQQAAARRAGEGCVPTRVPGGTRPLSHLFPNSLVNSSSSLSLVVACIALARSLARHLQH